MVARSSLRPFFIASGAWGFLCLGISLLRGDPAYILLRQGALIILCLADLWALVQVTESIFQWNIAEVEKRGAALVRAFFWATLKLVCLGILILWMSYGTGLAGGGLVMGIGTLVVVPLVGGFFWSRRECTRVDLTG